jgi:hypothetical protein
MVLSEDLNRRLPVASAEYHRLELLPPAHRELAMAWWMILGSICLVLFVAAVVFLVVIGMREKKREEKVRAEGVPTLGWIVQANNVLWEEGSGDNAAQILITFDEELKDDPERMLELALKLGRLKSEPPEDDMEEEIAQLVIDETARFSTRYKLPRKFTGGPVVYSIAVMVRRKYLPEGKITLPYIHCVGLPGKDGGAVYMTEYPDEDDDRPRRRRRRDD